MYAIIGGSGLATLPELNIASRRVVRTPYGEPSCPILFGKIGPWDIAFLARHGFGHTLAPHEINYRANIWALKECGVSDIFSVAAVASIDDAFTPGSIYLPLDVIDYTWGRASTFFEGQHSPVVHASLDPPYASSLRLALHQAAKKVTVLSQGVYACVQGPRMPTAAEARRYHGDGAHLIGMTGMPELTLARELNMNYLHVCGVIGWAAGAGAQGETARFREGSPDAIDEIRRLIQEMAQMA